MIKIERMPDSDEIYQAVKDNDGYCPCAREKTLDTKCMCKQFRETLEGICHCGLYVKKKVEEK